MVEPALERHQRTALLVHALAGLEPARASAVLDDLAFAVSAAGPAMKTRAGQAALLTTVNVLARTGGQLQLSIPTAPLLLTDLPWRGGLDEVAARIAVWAGGRLSSGRTPLARVHVGPQREGDAVLIGGDGVTARIDSPEPDQADGPLTLGAVVAAYLGCARAFHLALQTVVNVKPVGRRPVAWTILADRPALSIPAFSLVGAGAVAHGLFWAIALGGLRLAPGSEVCDPQSLDRSNLNRHQLAGVDDVGRPKVEVVASFAAALGGLRPSVARFRAGAEPAALIVSTVDNDETRYEIQGAMPRRVAHAATSGESVSAAMLDFSDGACLGCLFPRAQISRAAQIARETGLPEATVATVLNEDGAIEAQMLVPIAQRLDVTTASLDALIGRRFREVYARELCGRLPISASRPDAPAATIAYASGLAGALLAAELIRQPDAHGHAWRRNYLQLSAAHPEARWETFREKQADCPLMCGDASLQSFFRSLHEATES